MKPPTAPIRFLLLVAGGWIGFRAVALLPDWDLGDVRQAAAGSVPPAGAASGQTNAPPLEAAVPAAGGQSPGPLLGARPIGRTSAMGGLPVYLQSVRSLFLPVDIVRAPHPAAETGRQPASTSPPLVLRLPVPTPAGPSSTSRRWAASAWLFLRDKGAAELAPGGTLGGSQAGLRFAYRLNNDALRPLSLSGRLYVPVDRPAGAEAAAGLDWRPIASIPVHLLVERRQRLGHQGRSDFGLTLYGGIERRVLRERVRIEAYGQAGIVGIEERDVFADGAVRASVRAGRIELGAGAWGGVQPGASRLDIGPHATFRLPIGGTNLRASVEWRFRVAGDAAPDSGPAFTIATDF